MPIVATSDDGEHDGHHQRHAALPQEVALPRADDHAERELHRREEAAPAPQQPDDPNAAEQSRVVTDAVERGRQFGARVLREEREDRCEHRRLRALGPGREPEDPEQTEDQGEHAHEGGERHAGRVVPRLAGAEGRDEAPRVRPHEPAGDAREQPDHRLHIAMRFRVARHAGGVLCARVCARRACRLGRISRQVHVLGSGEPHRTGHEVVSGHLVDEAQHLLADPPVARMALR